MNQQKVKKISKLLGKFEEYFTAFAAYIISKGRVVQQKFCGCINLEYSIPANKNSIFPISSMTKQFTAMIIMMMAEEGKIFYTDTLRKFLPDFPEYGEGITLEHLLYQTSGLLDGYDYYFENDMNFYGITNEKLYQLLLEQDSLRFIPGEQFDYCNSNYMLLAIIAEKIYSTSFDMILKEKVFMPLGMINSSIFDTSVIPNRVYGYRYNNSKYFSLDNGWLSYGDGGIMSSIADLFLWDQALKTDKLVSKETLTRAFSSGKTNSGKDIGYGFGWGVKEINNIKILTHGGSDPGFGSIISRVPQKDYSIIMLTNLDESREILRGLADEIHEVILTD